MKNPFITLPLIALLLVACGHSKLPRYQAAISKDTLTYTYHTSVEHAPGCGNKPPDSCSTAIITYPEFKPKTALNDTITRQLIRSINAHPAKDPQTLATDFVAGQEELKKTKPGKSPFKLNLYARVIRQDSSLTTIETGGSNKGGQHTISRTLFINWNTKAAMPVTLDDILVDGYKPKLNTIAERIFRKSENLTDTSSLARDYFFKGGKFALNHNYMITPVGIRFLYNTGEIKPDAAGTTDLFIPYTQIKALLKPGTVTQQYIK